jgi:MSHA biogenesis protein MshI
MRLFSKTKKTTGWMAICFQEDGVCVVHVKRDPSAKPVVELAAFFPAEKAPDAELLEKLGKEVHASRHHCSTVLRAGEYQIVSVEAPNVAPDELKTAIRWKLKDLLDFHVDDATVDVLDVPMEKNAAGRSHSMYAIATRNHLIEQRQNLFAQANIPLSVIDIPEMAQRNVSALLEPEGRGVAFLSFNADGGLLTVSFNGELYLSRRIDVSASQLTQAQPGQETSLFDKITLELQRSLDHLDRQYHFVTIPKLLLAPLGQAEAGLREHLAANLYVPVESLNLEDVLDLTKTPELKAPDLQRRYFMALGAALRHEEKAL